MKNLLKRVKTRIRRMNEWRPPVSSFADLITIGTEYGGWTIPANYLTESSICYLAGAGEDISFDVGIVEKYGCQVLLFDPTPRAKAPGIITKLTLSSRGQLRCTLLSLQVPCLLLT